MILTQFWFVSSKIWVSLVLFFHCSILKQKNPALNDKRCYCVVENGCGSPTQRLFMINSHMKNKPVPSIHDPWLGLPLPPPIWPLSPGGGGTPGILHTCLEAPPAAAGLESVESKCAILVMHEKGPLARIPGFQDLSWMAQDVITVANYLCCLRSENDSYPVCFSLPAD